MARRRQISTAGYTKKSLHHESFDGVKPIFLLMDETDSIVKKCFCANCQTVTPFYSWNPQPNIFSNSMACPDCGMLAEVDRVTPMSQRDADNDTASTKINHTGAWKLPLVPVSQDFFKFENSAGDCTRLETNLMLRRTVVFPSNNSYQFGYEYSDVMDFDSNSHYMTKTRVDGTSRIEEDIKDFSDLFIIGVESFDINHMHSQITGYSHPSDETCMFYGIHTAKNGLLLDLHLSDQWKLSKSRLIENGQIFQNVISEHLMDRFSQSSVANKFYTDILSNDLFNGDSRKHAADRLNLSNLVSYTTMIVKYPTAVEYAMERANNRVRDTLFRLYDRSDAITKSALQSIVDKCIADSSYVPYDESYIVNGNECKIISEAGVRRLFRDEMEYVAEQLFSIDDDILLNISRSHTLDEMKQVLAKYAFGDDAPYDNTGSLQDVSSFLIAKYGSAISKEDIDNATSLWNRFSNNPIGVANTLHVCNQIGFANVDSINAMLDIADASPDVHLIRHRNYGNNHYRYENNSCYRNANTIIPISSKSQLEFLKRYVRLHSEVDLINDMYVSEAAYDIACKAMRIYCHYQSHNGLSGMDVLVSADELDKRLLDRYLQHKSVEEAYVDFAEKYGADTKSIVDRYAYEIAVDRKLSEMQMEFKSAGSLAVATTSDLSESEKKKVYMREGYKAIATKYADFIDSFPPYCDKRSNVEARFKDNPENYVKGLMMRYVSSKDSCTIGINVDEIFAGTMSEIGSNMTRLIDIRKYSRTTDFTFSPVGSLNKISVSTVPSGSSYYFKTVDSAGDLMNTLLELNVQSYHLASLYHSSHRHGISHDCTCVTISDEMQNVVGCLQLISSGSGSSSPYSYECFIGPNGESTPSDVCAGAILQWCRNNHVHIDCQQVSDLSKHATTYSLEDDPVLLRREKAKSVYDLNENGDIAVTTISDMPDYLR